jgi:hypothetical protein
MAKVTAITIVIALVFDLFLLPAILLLVDKKKETQELVTKSEEQIAEAQLV